MKWVLTPLLLITVAEFLPAEPVKAKPPQRKPAVSSIQKTASAKSASSSHKRTTHARGRRARRAPAPAYQLHPDPTRYAEIQKALADRGYFKGEVNGQWNDDSVDALKRFQADQKLEPDGKINSLSLIGLGLGPKHDVSFAPPHATSPSSASEHGTIPVTPPAQPSTASEGAPAPAAPPN
jgi:hypothetical protein